MSIEILVLQRGWVVVGQVEEKGNELEIKNGFVIRKWGTSSGLGELATKGPLSETKLDAMPDTKVHQLTTVLRMKCSPEWEAQCKAR